MLRDPYWVRSAADDLKEHIDIPQPYTRYRAVLLDTKGTAYNLLKTLGPELTT